MAKIMYYTFNPYTQYIAILDTKDSYVPCIWIKTIVYKFGLNPYTMHKYTKCMV